MPRIGMGMREDDIGQNRRRMRSAKRCVRG
jgi:hypothetical protein